MSASRRYLPHAMEPSFGALSTIATYETHGANTINSKAPNASVAPSYHQSINNGGGNTNNSRMAAASPIALDYTTIPTFETRTMATKSFATTIATRRSNISRHVDDDDDEEEQMPPPRYPPCRISRRSSMASKLATPIMNKRKATPGRLFVRMPMNKERNISYELGEFSIGIQFTAIESYHVEKARRKLEKKAEKELKKNPPTGVYGDAGGGLEQRDDIETTAENIRQLALQQVALLQARLEAPKLASLQIRHTSPISDDPKFPSASVNATATVSNTIWSSAPGINFIGAASLSSIDIQTSGSMSEQIARVYKIQTIDAIRRGPAHVITMVGQLGHAIVNGELPPDSPRYSLQFQLVQETRALKFTLRVEGGEVVEEGYDYSANSAQIFVQTGGEEEFFGLGARMSRPNLKGMEVQVCHPSSSSSNSSNGNNQYSSKQTSNSSTIPHIVSSNGTSLHLHNVEPTIFDFTSNSRYSVRTPCSVLSGTFISATSLLHALELHTALKGRTRPLPKWTQRNGVLVGIQGGTHAVSHVCKVLFKYRCPLAGLLIKDWTGTKSMGTGNTTNSGSNSSWYNYVLEKEHYTGWQSLMDKLERRGISVGLYLTPYLEEIPMHLRSGRRYLFGEASGDYFVKKRVVDMNATNKNDKDGISNGGGTITNNGTSVTMYNHFKKSNNCGMLDPTNHNATTWFKQIIKKEVLEYASASFWLADTASLSGPPMDGLYTSESNNGLAFHNSYAEKWAKVNRDAIREAGRDGDGFFIVNSAYNSTAKHAGCTSLGDYVTNFHHDNGGILGSILNGIVNGGFSGLTHGHCAINLAVPRQLTSSLGSAIDSKSREMICRWMEMTAFTTLFRTHDGECGMNDGNGGRSTLCAYEDEVVMKQLTRWSHVYVALSEYRLLLLNEASFKGYPVVRHPILHFPNDGRFNGSCLTKEKKKKDGGVGGDCGVSSFMLGDLVYVVPVVKSGVVKRKVYLPEGAWIHLWTGEQVAGPHSIGKTIEVLAPVGEPPVFIRDCDIMHQFVAILKQKRIITTYKMKKSSSTGNKSSLFSSFRRKN